MNASRWTLAALEALGPTTDVPTVASVFGVNKETVYAQIRRGEWTATRVLPIGRKLRIPTRDLITLLYPLNASEPRPPQGPGSNNSPASSEDNADEDRTPAAVSLRAVQGDR